jgi:site-specific recombinase XerD
MPSQDFEAKVERIMGEIRDSEAIHPANAAQIEEWRRDMVLDGLSPATQQKNLSYIKVVARELGDRPFEELEQDDLKELVADLHDQDLSQATVQTYKKIIRQFWSWLVDEESYETDYPPVVDWLTIKTRQRNSTLPTELLTKEEIEAQIGAANNPRDKALIAFLYETGARIGEILDLEVGAIEDQNKGRKVVIDGKTGARRLPLIYCVLRLNKWLNQHPDPTKDAPLWSKLRDASDSLRYQ